MVYYLLNANVKIKLKNGVCTKARKFLFFTILGECIHSLHTFFEFDCTTYTPNVTHCDSVNQSIQYHHHQHWPKSLYMHQCNYYILSKIEWMAAIFKSNTNFYTDDMQGKVKRGRERLYLCVCAARREWAKSVFMAVHIRFMVVCTKWRLKPNTHIVV